MVAILQYWEESSKNDAELKKFVDVLKEYNVESKEEAGLAVGDFNSQLSDNVHDRTLESKANWNNETAVMDGLTYWNIGGNNVLVVARALFRMRTVRLGM